MKSAVSSWSQLPAQEKAAIQEECSDYDKQRSAEVDPAKVIKETVDSDIVKLSDVGTEAEPDNR